MYLNGDFAIVLSATSDRVKDLVELSLREPLSIPCIPEFTFSALFAKHDNISLCAIAEQSKLSKGECCQLALVSTDKYTEPMNFATPSRVTLLYSISLYRIIFQLKV